MKESFEKNKKGILLMIIAAVLACVGQLFWKLSAESGIWYMLAGFALYGTGAVFMLTAYRFGSVSVLQPMMSTNYALSAVLGILVLNEKISALKVIGIFVITTGVILVGGGDAQDSGGSVQDSRGGEAIGSDVQDSRGGEAIGSDAQDSRGGEAIGGDAQDSGGSEAIGSDAQDSRGSEACGGDGE